MTQSMRQASAWLHGWSGLLLGWLAFVICFSGSLAVFRPEISQWMRPELAGRTADPASAVQSAVDRLGTIAPAAPAWFLVAPDARNTVTQAAWFDASAPGGFRLAALDPLTGRADIARDTLGGDVFYRLHFELEMPYPWGRLLASLAAAVLLVAIVSGIVVHRRFFSDMFTLRPGKGVRSWLDAHNLFGVVALPFHLMITYSGLVTLASLSMPWGVTGAYGANSGAFFADLSPAFLERTPKPEALPLAPVKPMLEEAARRFGPGAHVGIVTVEHPGDAAATVTISRNDTDQLQRQPATITFDGTTGRPLRMHAETRPAARTYGVVYGLHMGRFATTDLRWFYFVGGLLLTATIGSGLVLWVSKRAARARGFGNELLARMNAGVIAGTPAAFMALFIANRLLPAHQPGRAAAETAALFWTGGAALLLALCLPSRRALPVLLGLSAVACGTGAVLGVCLAPAGLDEAIVGGSLVMATFGIALAAAAARAGRHPALRTIGRARGTARC